MNFDIKGSIFLFLFIIFLAFSLFYGFVPYEWVCEYHYQLGISKSCNIPHILVFFISLTFYILALFAYKNFNVVDIFTGKG